MCLHEYGLYLKSNLFNADIFCECCRLNEGLFVNFNKNKIYFGKSFRFVVLIYVLLIEGDEFKLKITDGRGSVNVGSLKRKYRKYIFN